jgi:hypothetical protein
MTSDTDELHCTSCGGTTAEHDALARCPLICPCCNGLRPVGDYLKHCGPGMTTLCNCKAPDGAEGAKQWLITHRGARQIGGAVLAVVAGFLSQRRCTPATAARSPPR